MSQIFFYLVLLELGLKLLALRIVEVVGGQRHVRRPQRGHRELEDIVVVREAARSRGDAEVAELGQDDVLHPHTHFIILVVVAHAIMKLYGERVFVVLDFGPHSKRFVPEIPETT